jgi:hypothetical protein
LEEVYGGEDGVFSELEKVSKANVAARFKEIKGDKEAKCEAATLNEWLNVSNERGWPNYSAAGTFTSVPAALVGGPGRSLPCPESGDLCYHWYSDANHLPYNPPSRPGLRNLQGGRGE